MNNFLNQIPSIKHIDSKNFFLIAGPCVIESEELCFTVAEKMIELSEKYKIPYIFKASYRKANRTKLDSFAGIGDLEGLKILSKIKKSFSVPVITDIHTPEEAYFVAGYVDILQIPAFLCRQTDLIVAAAKTNKVLNIKKGQFVSPYVMQYAVEKAVLNGNNKVMLTERGSMFGYNDLVVDFRSIPIMKSFNVPVILDITHSVQKPNLPEGVSGGMPEMIETLALAGLATGVDGIFMETHPDPAKALSDGTNMLPLKDVERLLQKMIAIHNARKTFN